jgi:3-methyladenine DNA glycosylase/8-oxoguanine DNA glycosylase
MINMSKRAITHLSSDPVMLGLIEKVGPIRLRPRRLSPFQSLTHAIIHQQLNSNAAGTILERFKRLFPDEEFPTPSQVAKTSVDRLRTAGLSRPKAAYIIDLARLSQLESVWMRKCLQINFGSAKVCSHFPSLLSP